jgi:hypothetical protein
MRGERAPAKLPDFDTGTFRLMPDRRLRKVFVLTLTHRYTSQAGFSGYYVSPRVIYGKPKEGVGGEEKGKQKITKAGP